MFSLSVPSSPHPLSLSSTHHLPYFIKPKPYPSVEDHHDHYHLHEGKREDSENDDSGLSKVIATTKDAAANDNANVGGLRPRIPSFFTYSSPLTSHHWRRSGEVWHQLAHLDSLEGSSNHHDAPGEMTTPSTSITPPSQRTSLPPLNCKKLETWTPPPTSTSLFSSPTNTTTTGPRRQTRAPEEPDSPPHHCLKVTTTWSQKEHHNTVSTVISTSTAWTAVGNAPMRWAPPPRNLTPDFVCNARERKKIEGNTRVWGRVGTDPTR